MDIKDYIKRLNDDRIYEHAEGMDPEWLEGEDKEKVLKYFAEVGGPWKKILDERVNSNRRVVFQVGEFYIAVDGYYSSYDGTNFDEGDGFYQVKPEQETITVYTKVE